MPLWVSKFPATPDIRTEIGLSAEAAGPGNVSPPAPHPFPDAPPYDGSLRMASIRWMASSGSCWPPVRVRRDGVIDACAEAAMKRSGSPPFPSFFMAKAYALNFRQPPGRIVG